MMKTWIISLSALLLISLSLALFAQKTLINTKPALLQANGNYYSFPASYTHQLNRFHYVIIGSEHRVCYIYPQNNLASLDLLQVNLELHNKRFYWYCYRFDSRFFEIKF